MKKHGLGSIQLNEFQISKDDTAMLKGLAILFVLWSHYLGWIYDGTYTVMDTIIQKFFHSEYGVSIFLFLSGYGLSFSRSNNGFTIKEYIKKRLRGVYLPYITVQFAVLILFIILGKDIVFDVKLFLSILGVWPYHRLDSSMWYITYCIYIYVIWAIGNLNKNRLCRHLVVIIGIVLMSFTVLNHYLRYTGMYALSFYFGMIYQEFCDQKNKKAKFLERGIVYIGVIGYFSLVLLKFSPYSYPIVNTILRAIVPIAFLCFVKLIERIPVLKRLFNSVGQYSYEIYLVEAIIMLNFTFIYDCFGKGWIAFCAFFAVTFLAAYVLKKFLASSPGAIQRIRR